MGRDANDDARVGRRERAVVAARGPRGVVAVAAENGLFRLLARELHGFVRTGDVRRRRSRSPHIRDTEDEVVRRYTERMMDKHEG